jgi:hypothetical protein
VLQQRSSLARDVLKPREDIDEQLEADMPRTRCPVDGGAARFYYAPLHLGWNTRFTPGRLIHAPTYTG